MPMYYTEEHEWVRVEGNTATVGITDHAQEQLGDVVFVELPEVGRKVSKGGDCAVVESVKAASDVFAAISGEVIEVNEALADNPGLVNEDAENGAWFYKLAVSDEAELEELMDRDAYDKHLASLD